MMTEEKKIQLEQAYTSFIDSMRLEIPVEKLHEYVIPDVMGYGTTVDEKVFDIQGLVNIVEMQEKQSENIHFDMIVTPVHRKVTDDENSAVYVDEVLVSMKLHDGINEFTARVSTVLDYIDGKWKVIHWHGSKAVETEGDTWHKEEWKKKNEELQRLVQQKTADLEKKNRELEIEAALERIRAQVTAMQESSGLLDIVVMMQAEFTRLGHEAHYFWHMRWLPDKYEKALTNGDGTRIGNVLELPRGFHGLKTMLDWEKSEEPSGVFALDPETAADYIDKMITLGRFQEIDHSAPGPDEVRAMGGLTFVMARTTHGEIGYTLPGEVPNPPEEDIATLVRFAAVFDLAYRRFRDLTQAHTDLQLLKEEKKRAEDALSELKSTQAQLIHAEKMASLGELTAGIAHEIQNPLNFVNNFSEVNLDLINELKAEMKNGDMEEVDALVNDITRNEEKINYHGKRADSIVKGMLQHSRSSNGQKVPTDINALADEYLRLSYHGLRAKDKSFNADFRVEADPSLPDVRVVPQDIGRVLLNLINNAFFSVSEKNKQPDDGYKPEVIVRTKKLGKMIEIRVKDNGTGIPEEIRDKIFQPFFTTKPTGEGTGLGLSMSYDIITKGHGGKLKVESQAGEGTEFIISIPIEK